MLGLAFKPETDDVRDAPSLDLVRALVDEGARVRAYDPRSMEEARRWLPPSVDLVDSPAEAAEEARALVLVTEWEEIIGADWEAVSRRMLSPRFVFDGRNALDPYTLTELGFEYVGVGRGAALQPAGDAPKQREIPLHA